LKLVTEVDGSRRLVTRLRRNTGRGREGGTAVRGNEAKVYESQRTSENLFSNCWCNRGLIWGTGGGGAGGGGLTWGVGKKGLPSPASLGAFKSSTGRIKEKKKGEREACVRGNEARERGFFWWDKTLHSLDRVGKNGGAREKVPRRGGGFG